jgi:putative sterol carrier protein
LQAGATVKVEAGRRGKANLVVKADSKTWLAFLAKEQNIFLGGLGGINLSVEQ